MPRQTALRQLHTVGFNFSTGASFSVTPLTELGTTVPFANHSVMLMRHHRVLAETQAAGMGSAPNLYWLDGDGREVRRWAEWLFKNPAIHTISRDFTSTTHPNVVKRKVSELLFLLNLAGRSFHVLVIGTGPANAPKIVSALAQAGHTVTVVTSAPIMKAHKGRKYDFNDAGELIDAPCDRTLFPTPRLIENNLALFEEFLFAAVGNTVAATAVPNVRLG